MEYSNEELEKIRILSEQLVGLLTNSNSNTIQDNMCVETLNKLKTIGVDYEHVLKIMNRADELKGRTDRYRTSEALYESISKLLK